MKVTILSFFLALFFVTSSFAQSSYITNVYTCSNIVFIDDFAQPNSVSNLWKANTPNLELYNVANVISIGKGVHSLKVIVKDANDKVFNTYTFEPTTADSETYPHSLFCKVTGRFPEGNFTFEWIDEYKGKSEIILKQMITFKSW